MPTIRARILVADDLEIIQKLTRSFPETAGHEVDVVPDGAQAVAAVQGASYDLVLMDIQMPGMDGITAIIAMTVNVSPQQVRSYEDAGMNDHISKPLQREILLNKIYDWLPPSSVPARPDFDMQGFHEFRNLMGSDEATSSLAKFKDQLERAFSGEYSDPSDREQLARHAHALVSHAGLLGFPELSRLCSELEGACTSGEDFSAPLDKARKASRATRELIGQWMGGAKQTE